MRLFLLLTACAACAGSPVRKLVHLLQDMQQKVEHEGEVEAELFDRSQCRCREELLLAQQGLASVQQRLPGLRQAHTEQSAELQKLKLEVETQKKEREEAQQSLAEARSMRRKEQLDFESSKEEQEKGIESIGKALAALKKGMAQRRSLDSFLQTDGFAVLKGFLERDGRQELLDLLQNAESYVPRSGEVLGMLKQMAQDTRQSLQEAEETETKAEEEFRELSAAKAKEVKALTASIEEKMEHLGELKVAVVHLKSDVDDAETAQEDQQKVLRSLQSSCSKKASAWEVKVKHRNEELNAIGETIKVLNSDDARESFKKALPRGSLLQVDSTAHLQARVRESLHQASPVKTDLILMALRGKKISYEKVIQMIDGMKATMKKEQENEDTKKEYCKQQFTSSGDKKKDLILKVSKKETNIESAKDALKITNNEIKELREVIARSDRDAAAATEQRKKEHEEFQEVISENEGARGLLEVAKKRLKQFYSKPSLVEVLQHRAEAPDYEKKSPQALQVLMLLEGLMKETEGAMSEAQRGEKEDQKDYEEFILESSKKREGDSKSIVKKTAQRAELLLDLQALKDAKRLSQKELGATEAYVKSLHGDCDWLLANFEARNDARDEELESLERAKAVLKGADLSFLQVRRFRR